VATAAGDENASENYYHIANLLGTR
jgi:hypothetical protein